MSGFGRFYPPSTPRKVTGGLAARSGRGAIGETWWSQRFVGALESLALGSRLTRGKNYARRGQVLSLDIAPGVVTSRVQGSRAAPYKVAIGLAPFTEALWSTVEAALAAEAIYSAALLAGQMPADLEAVLARVGAPLFPQAVRDLRMSCSCPDDAVPCKHLAATLYLLAERFDDDPFEILHWRGRSKAELLERLRALRTRSTGTRAGKNEPGKSEPGPASIDVRAGTVPEGAAAGALLALADFDDSLAPESAQRHWLAPVPLPAPGPTLEADVDLLLRQLPEPGAALGGGALVADLSTVYARLPDAPEADIPGFVGSRE